MLQLQSDIFQPSPGRWNRSLTLDTAWGCTLLSAAASGTASPSTAAGSQGKKKKKENWKQVDAPGKLTSLSLLMTIQKKLSKCTDLLQFINNFWAENNHLPPPTAREIQTFLLQPEEQQVGIVQLGGGGAGIWIPDTEQDTVCHIPDWLNPTPSSCSPSLASFPKKQFHLLPGFGCDQLGGFWRIPDKKCFL